jgi:uncharacterized membrane protein
MSRFSVDMQNFLQDLINFPGLLLYNIYSSIFPRILFYFTIISVLFYVILLRSRVYCSFCLLHIFCSSFLMA